MPLASLLVLAAAAQPAGCGLTDPGACPSTNVLLASPGVVDGVRALTGGKRANYLRAGLPAVAEQALDVLAGPSRAPRQVAGGWLFTACRQDSCGEQGALMVAGGKVVAVGIVHGACGVQRDKEGCARQSSLSLFGGEDLSRWRRAIVEWAERERNGLSLPVFENGIDEPVSAIDGEFDGDLRPDRAAVVASAGGGYRVAVTRGIAGDALVPVTPVAQPEGVTLRQGEGGTLAIDAGGAAPQVARWSGEAYVVSGAGR